MNKRSYIIVLVVLWLIYGALTLVAPGHQATSRYGLTPTELNLLRLTILLPYLFIWLSALTAILHFKAYRPLLGNSAESVGFKKIIRGLWLLLLVLMVPSFINLISTFFHESAATIKSVAIVSSYITIALYMVAFWQLFRASQILNKTLELHGKYQKLVRPSVFITIAALAGVYVWLVFSNPFRTASSDPLIRATYFLPDSLIVLTILIPYILMWFYGSLAVANFMSFSQNVAGVIYRKAFRYAAYGLMAVIMLSIALQFLSQSGGYLGHATVKAIIGIIYLILFALAVAYTLIARGARKLTAIEKA
jgi:hypothetical protein